MRHYKIAGPARYYELSRVVNSCLETNAARLRRNSVHRAQMWRGLPYVTRATTTKRDRSTALVYRELKFPFIHDHDTMESVLNTWEDASRPHNWFLLLLVNYFNSQNIFVWKSDAITISKEMILNWCENIKVSNWKRNSKEFYL